MSKLTFLIVALLIIPNCFASNKKARRIGWIVTIILVIIGIILENSGL